MFTPLVDLFLSAYWVTKTKEKTCYAQNLISILSGQHEEEPVESKLLLISASKKENQMQQHICKAYVNNY